MPLKEDLLALQGLSRTVDEKIQSMLDAISATEPLPGSKGVDDRLRNVESAVFDLPKEFLNTGLPAFNGKMWNTERDFTGSTPGDRLRAALAAIKTGDIKGGDGIEIQAGPDLVYTGRYNLFPSRPPDQTEGEILICSSNRDKLPEAIGKDWEVHKANLANFQITTYDHTITATASNLARNYRALGLAVTMPSNMTNPFSYSVFSIGRADPTLIDQIPENIILDKCVVYFDPLKQQAKRGVSLHGNRSSVVRSHISGLYGAGIESQAIHLGGGLGPNRIHKCYLDAGGENIFYGGYDPAMAGNMQCDGEITNNRIVKNRAVKEMQNVVKNLVESKFSQRVLVEGNIFYDMWGPDQSGSAIVLKSEDQSGLRAGDIAWAQTSDWTIRYNRFDNVPSAIGISGLSTGTELDVLRLLNRVQIENNLMTPGTWDGDKEAFLRIGSRVSDVIVHCNTAFPAMFAIVILGGNSKRVVFDSNLLYAGKGGSWSKGVTTGSVEGIAALAALYAVGEPQQFLDNVMIAATTTKYPESTQHVATVEEAVVDYAGGNYRSRFPDVGANIDKLEILNSQVPV